MKYFEQRLDEENLKSKRLAWMITFASCTLTLISMGTVAYLAPLKQTEVKLLVVDKNTGYPSEVTALSKFATGDIKKLSQTQAINKYFAGQFINLFESYNFYSVREAYSLVKLYANEPVFAQYNAKFNPPIDIEKTIGRERSLKVEIMSIEQTPAITPFKSDNDGVTMRARIEKRVIAKGVAVQTISGTVTMTIGYDTALQMDERTRNLNPFGFTVTSYQFTPDQKQAEKPKSE